MTNEEIVVCLSADGTKQVKMCKSQLWKHRGYNPLNPTECLFPEMDPNNKGSRTLGVN